MGRYSYNQLSSSDEHGADYARIIQEEADLYADEADSSHTTADLFKYPYGGWFSSETEANVGIPKICYCGVEHVVATAHTSKDPWRRHFTCDNADDGECHVWKWWDVAVMEELSDYQRQLRQLKDQHNERDEKLVKLEQSVWELDKKKSWVTMHWHWLFLL